MANKELCDKIGESSRAADRRLFPENLKNPKQTGRDLETNGEYTKKMGGTADTVPPKRDFMEFCKTLTNYLAAFAAFHSAIFARTSLLMFQMKVKQQKEPRAAMQGKPTTISLMPAMVPSA